MDPSDISWQDSERVVPHYPDTFAKHDQSHQSCSGSFADRTEPTCHEDCGLEMLVVAAMIPTSLKREEPETPIRMATGR